MRIATYNINGVNGRLASLLSWLERVEPDVVCLQELKTPNASFPLEALRRAGYRAVVRGQRAHHGVAILARGVTPIVTRRALPGDDADRESRYLEAAVSGVLIASIYAPNGNPHPGPRFDYKLAWLERLVAHAQSLYDAGVPVVLAGDYNVVPTDRDIYDARSSWRRDALLAPAARTRYQQLLAQGWVDALRAKRADAEVYTFWDYKRDAWARGAGLRIDHCLVSPSLVSRLVDADVDIAARGEPGSSDHAPMWIRLR